MGIQTDSLTSSTASLRPEDTNWVNVDAEEEFKERHYSGDSNVEEEEFEVLDGESQEVQAVPCGTHPKDLSLENEILANFPDGCNRSHTVELKDEDSYDIIPNNLTFAEVISILDQAIKENNYEELNKVVQNIEDYESQSIALDSESFKISVQIN